MKVIGVASQMQNGKDTCANYLKDKLSMFEIYTRAAFAASVKRVYSETFDVSMEFIEEWKVKAENPPGFDMSVRQGLQFIGDGFRKIQPNIWIDLAFRNKTHPMIISDGRYINELKKIKSLDGITILLWRPSFENNDSNGSEAQIKPLVDWFKELYNMTGLEGALNLLRETDDFPAISCHEYMPLVDLFLVNNGTKEDFYEKIDRLVVPYVRWKWYQPS